MDGYMLDDPFGRIFLYHRRRYWLSNGWSLRFRIRPVEPTPHRPHGIRYSFVLHDADGSRLLGFDNAHGVPRGGVEHYHSHRFRDVQVLVSYQFVDADTLLADFFLAVKKACATEDIPFDIVDEDMEKGDEEDEEDDSRP